MRRVTPDSSAMAMSSVQLQGGPGGLSISVELTDIEEVIFSEKKIKIRYGNGYEHLPSQRRCPLGLSTRRQRPRVRRTAARRRALTPRPMTADTSSHKITRTTNRIDQTPSYAGSRVNLVSAFLSIADSL